MAFAASAQTMPADPFDQAVRIPRILAGPLAVGEDHPLFDLGDFPLSVEGEAAGIEAAWIEGSQRWVRASDGLALPQARLRIGVRAAPERALARWRGRAVAFQGDADGAFAEIFVPLLEGGEARVELDGRSAARVRVAPARPISTPPGARHAVDHSCSPWGLSIAGLDDAFVSINCRLIPIGRVGSEAPLLEVRWAAAGVTLPDGSAPPFSAQLRGGRPARATLIGPDGRSRVVEISAVVPTQWHRLRLAVGAGDGVAASLMLYGNLRLRPEDGLSLRTFDEAVFQSPAQTAFFNNLGLYFAYDVARVLDRRLSVTALIGMQGVTFAPAGLSHQVYNEALFPQGLEISYVDAFGLKSKTLSGGAFLQPATNKPYQNFWIRFGGRWFGEMNYLSWRSGDRSARAWGVSVGVPLAQLF